MNWLTCDNCEQRTPIFWHERYGQLCEFCYDDEKTPKREIWPRHDHVTCECVSCKIIREIKEKYTNGGSGEVDRRV